MTDDHVAAPVELNALDQHLLERGLHGGRLMTKAAMKQINNLRGLILATQADAPGLRRELTTAEERVWRQGEPSPSSFNSMVVDVYLKTIDDIVEYAVNETRKINRFRAVADLEDMHRPETTNAKSTCCELVDSIFAGFSDPNIMSVIWVTRLTGTGRYVIQQVETDKRVLNDHQCSLFMQKPSHSPLATFADAVHTLLSEQANLAEQVMSTQLKIRLTFGLNNILRYRIVERI